MATAQHATPSSAHTTGRVRFVAVVVLGPIMSVALFILGIALLQGIPPTRLPHDFPVWLSLLFLIVPFLVGLLLSARGVTGLTGWSVWASTGAALVIVVVGIALISVVLWRVGWPVLVTGGY